jgi:fucose permease
VIGSDRASSRSRRRLLALAFVAFVSLGLPDGLLGVAWPSIRGTFGVSSKALGTLLVPFTVSYALSSFAGGTVLARMTVGGLLAASCLATGLSLGGYATAVSWWVMVACAGLLGLGAGAIDAGVNAYVATHHGPRTLNWMHAAYGIGAAAGPLIMTRVLASGRAWQLGYAVVAVVQLVLAAAFVASRSWWPAPQRRGGAGQAFVATPAIATLRVGRAWLGIGAFFAYTGIEAIAGVWAYSLLTSARGLTMQEAGMAVTLYWASLTAGRVIFALVVERAWLTTMLRAVLCLLTFAAILVCVAASTPMNLFAFALLGLAAGPVFPSLMSATPDRLGESHAHNAIGFQVAAAALGQSLLPALVGLISPTLGLEVVGPALVTASVVLFALVESPDVGTRKAAPHTGFLDVRAARLQRRDGS